MGIKILGLGHCSGKKVVTNEELSEMTDLSDEWIIERTGIRSRHYAQNQNNAQMAAEAAEKAIKNAGISKEDIGACIVATFTPDMMAPPTACAAASYLGLSGDIIAFDINGACTGFLYALNTAEGVIKNSEKKYALVMGSEYISKLLDMGDPKTCALFGDGAGCAVVELSQKETYTFSGGLNPQEAFLYVHTKNPAIVMNGREVFRFAVDIVPKTIERLLEKSRLTINNIDHIVCHQANERIISNIIKQMGLPSEKFYINIDRYGNTSAASIPIALSEMAEKGMLKRGQKIICVGFGAGLTYGGTLLHW